MTKKNKENKENKNTKNTKNTKKEYWAVTVARHENGQLIWFGNLNGGLYTTQEGAWKAALAAYEEEKAKLNVVTYGYSCDPSMEYLELWDGQPEHTFNWVCEVQAVRVGGYGNGKEFKRL